VIRVLNIVTTLDIGGAEAQILDVVSRLDRARFHPVVAWLKGEGELAPEFEAAGVRAIRLGADRRALSPGPAIRLLRAFRPHVVHTHLGKADVVGATAARFAGVPVLVSTKHNEDDYLRYPPVAAFAHGIARLADKIVVISDAVGRFLRRTLLLPERHLRRIRYGYAPNGSGGGRDPDVAAELKSEFRIEQRAKIVTCVARLTKQKGLTDLLRAMSRLREATPEGMRSIFTEEVYGRIESQIALYDSEIVYMDVFLGRLLDKLKADGLFENTMIVITADHGELLGEDGSQLIPPFAPP